MSTPSSSLYEAACNSNSTSSLPPFVHPPTSFTQLLYHPNGFALILDFLKRTPHLTAIYLWVDLERLNRPCNNDLGGGGTGLTTQQRERIEASVLARLRASLIRKHREVSKAVQDKALVRRKPPTTKFDGVMEEEIESEEEYEESSEDLAAMKAAAVEFITPAPTSSSSAALATNPTSSAADSDLLLDVIKLQLIDEPSSSSDGSVLPSLASLTLSQDDGEDFALHSYATRLTQHLMHRLPQFQSHLEQMMSDKYWVAIQASKQFDALVKAGPPTEQSMAEARAKEQARFDAIASENIPPFNPSISKLVVIYLKKLGSAPHQPESASSSAKSPSPKAQSLTPAHSSLGETLQLPTSSPSSSSTLSSPSQPLMRWTRQTYYFDEFPQGVLLFGRSEHVDVTLPDSGVSRTHAKMVWSTPDASTPSAAINSSTKSSLTYHDLDSTYGSKLNGQPVTSGLLQIGSVLTLGKNVTLKIMKIDSRDAEKRSKKRLSGQLLAPKSTTALGDKKKNGNGGNKSISKCTIQ